MIFYLLLLPALLFTDVSTCDVIFLESPVDRIQCKVLEVTDEYVLVKIPRADVVHLEQAVEPEATADTPAADSRLAEPGISSGKQSLGNEPQAATEHKAMQLENIGSAEGFILWDGKPLANCELRINMIGASRFLGGHRLTDDEHFAITDANGLYRFEPLTPGHYKIFWKPPGESSWIRRLRMEPDFEVVAQEKTIVPPLEVHVGTLN